MAITPSDEIPFDEDDLSPAEEAVARLAAAGTGWVNLLPQVEPGEEPPPRSLFATIFSARGNAFPLATWAPSGDPGGRSSLGLQHGGGPKALNFLAEHNHPLPAGWLKVSDHPRRGFVVTAPDGTEPEELVWWLLTAAQILTTVPLTGAWIARVYNQSR